MTEPAAELALIIPTVRGELLHQILRVVSDAVPAEKSKERYRAAVLRFFADPARSFTRAGLLAFRAELQQAGYSASSVNQALSALRKLARECGSAGLLPPEAVAEIQHVPGLKERGARAGNWLTRAQAQELLNHPDPALCKGKRDRALLALLIGCALRRAELVQLTVEHIQQREARWVIVDLTGKGGRVRTIAVPTWVKQAVDEWTATASITTGVIARSVDRHGNIGSALTAQAVLGLTRRYGHDALNVSIRPHDLRRTCAKLCRAAGADLEQIQLLLGHSSVQTTERYLGTRQNLASAPNDRLGLG